MSFSSLNGQETTIETPSSELTNRQLSEVFESYLGEILSKGSTFLTEDPSRKSVINATLEELSLRAIPDGENERIELSNAWKSAAKILRATEGTTPNFAAALRMASDLNPKDLQLAKHPLPTGLKNHLQISGRTMAIGGNARSNILILQVPEPLK